MDILGTDRALDPDAAVTDQINLHAATPSGQQIKSSTIHLIGEDYNLALGSTLTNPPGLCQPDLSGI
jgi:hypothetical protein